MEEIGTIRRVVVSLLAAIAGGGIAFLVSMTALIVYADLRYSYPGSMTGAWAFANSLPIAAIGAVASLIVVFLKLRPKKQS